MAVPFALWALLTGRARVLATAAGFGVVGFGLYCLRAATGPLAVIRDYAAGLDRLYGRTPIVVGLSEVRPLIASALAEPLSGNLRAVILLALFVLVCAAGILEVRRQGRPVYAAPGLAALWSLLAFYHLSYGFIVLLPLATILLYADDSGTAVLRRCLFWALQLAMMFDVPGMWRRLDPYMATPAWVDTFAYNFDRIFVSALFVIVCVLAMRPASRTGQAP